MNNEVKLFDNPEFGKVRVIMRDGEPWFVASDVAKALGYADAPKAVQQHCEKVNKITQQGKTPVSQNTPPVNLLIIPEEDVYALIFGSHLESAKKFRRWLCDEVLPSIRKTGSYGVRHTVDISVKERLEAAKVVLECAGLTGNQLALGVDQLHYKALGYSALSESGTVLVAPIQEQMLTPTEIGKLLTPPLSGRLVNKMLEEHGYQHIVAKKWAPTAKGIEAGGELQPTSKWHHNGTPILQLKWPVNIVNALKVQVA